MRLGKKLAPGLTFTLPEKGTALYFEAQPWLELLQSGTFSKETLGQMPTSYQTTDPWYEMLKKSAEGPDKDSSGMTWLHALLLGINSAERGEIDEPRKYFEISLSLKPNPVAARCLAVLSKSYEEAWPYYETAWHVLHTEFSADPSFDRLSANLVTEMSFFLQQTGVSESYCTVLNQSMYI